MLDATPDSPSLAAIAFASNEQWLRVLGTNNALSTAELEVKLELKRTQTLEQLRRAETLKLIERIGPEGQGTRGYWTVTPSGKRVLAGLLSLLGRDDSLPPESPIAEAFGVLALLRPSDRTTADDAGDLYQRLAAAIPRRTPHELLSVRISRALSDST